MQRLERSFSSLAACYAFLASLAALLLLYARLELQTSPPDWSNLIGGLLHPSGSINSVRGAQLLAGARSALIALRDRMHTTWLFLAVFAAVWLGCLLWMQLERHRRGIDFSRREGWWIFGFTCLVFAIAVLYGQGTNSILAQRFPGMIPVSDTVAIAFVLALPLAAWSWLDRLQEDQEAYEFGYESPAGRSPGFLGLEDDVTNARLVESLSRLEVKPVDLLPAVQAFHPDAASEHTEAATTRLIEAAETPAAASVPESVPSSITASTEPAVAPVSTSAASSAGGAGIEGFRHHLAAMNQSWQRIEAIRSEIDEWFELRRREAHSRLEFHPGMRTSALEKSLLQNFPNDKLAAVDAEWAEIRNAALEINRWFSEVPAPSPSQSKD